MRILITNRGEISARIIRTVKKLGHTAIALERPGQDLSLIKNIADEIVFFNEELNLVQETYLSIPAILEIAKKSSIDAIHPGYGFLSESAEFAKEVKKSGIIFIGPNSKTLSLLGDKVQAKKFAESLKIPTIPGFEIPEVKEGVTKFISLCRDIGYPLMVKSCHGGGGKGMREVFSENELESAILSASFEAERAFGSGNIFIEKLISPARHIEVQLLGDQFGNCIHFFERDCSLQRKHQKLIEFSPAINIKENILNNLFSDSIRLGKSAKLTNLATVEFLVNPNDDKYYFIESNPRLQVEHTVTEEVTNLDLVEFQINIALGSQCIDQNNIKRINSSFQVRICAETPEKNFTPSTGIIDKISFPSNIRLETSYLNKSEITDEYDSLLAKLISKDTDWDIARKKILNCLHETIIEGVNTNINFLILALNENNFKPENYSISRLEENLKNFSLSQLKKDLIKKVFSYLKTKSSNTTKSPNIFSQSKKDTVFFKNYFYLAIPQLEILEKVFIKDYLPEDSFYGIDIHDQEKIMLDGYQIIIFKNYPLEISFSNENIESGDIEASLPCQIVELFVKKGDSIKSGQKLLTYESMKTEYTKYSPFNGSIVEIFCEKGSKLKKGEILIKLNPVNESQNK